MASRRGYAASYNAAPAVVGNGVVVASRDKRVQLLALDALDHLYEYEGAKQEILAAARADSFYYPPDHDPQQDGSLARASGAKGCIILVRDDTRAAGPWRTLALGIALVLGAKHRAEQVEDRAGSTNLWPPHVVRRSRRRH